MQASRNQHALGALLAANRPSYLVPQKWVVANFPVSAAGESADPNNGTVRVKGCEKE